MNATFYTQKISSLIENFNPNRLGIYFSLFFHLIILLFAIGLPDLFKPKPIILPNIIPIEIVNIAETTSITEKEINNNKTVEKKIVKQKKFNASENVAIKKLEIQEKPEITKKDTPDIVSKKENLEITKKDTPDVVSKKELIIFPKKEIVVKEKKITKKIEEEIIEPVKNIESLNIAKIKPKLKPKPKKASSNNFNTDVQINIKPQPKLNNIKTDVQINPKPQPKPKPDFSIASMLKDLRNEKTNNLTIQDVKEKEEKVTNSNINNNESENMTLSINEIDLLRQQLSSCWNAPAGAVIEKGMKVKISAKIQQNKRVIENSVRIVDTNIAKSNAFYGPITESAMRTLLKPECTPLKLPEGKFNLWKNLTITFDYSIMKGYSG